jgi:two-component system, LytTR family, sensor kinase
VLRTNLSTTPDVKRRPYWLLIALAPLIPAFFTAIRTYLQARFGEGYVDWRQITILFASWAFLGTLAPFVYVLANRYPIKRPRIIRSLLVHAFGAVTVCVVWGGFGILLGGLLNRFPWQGGLVKSFVPWMSILMSYSLLLYVLTLWAFLYYREARERESQQARLAAQLAEARLSALRMQLNPHFLFNSLNAITVLVRDQKSEDASEMLELLSDVLREVLQNKKNAETTLSEELAFIEKYLTIEQVRFSDRLEVQWSIELGTQDALVPEFVLQPLVENAIRHGIDHKTDGGIIEIIAIKTNGEISLSVRDNGPGFDSSAMEGLGLTNTRERLATLYGNAGQLTLTPAEGGGTIASLRLPVRRADE